MHLNLAAIILAVACVKLTEQFPIEKRTATTPLALRKLVEHLDRKALVDWLSNMQTGLNGDSQSPNLDESTYGTTARKWPQDATSLMVVFDQETEPEKLYDIEVNAADAPKMTPTDGSDTDDENSPSATAIAFSTETSLKAENSEQASLEGDEMSTEKLPEFPVLPIDLMMSWLAKLDPTVTSAGNKEKATSSPAELIEEEMDNQTPDHIPEADDTFTTPTAIQSEMTTASSSKPPSYGSSYSEDNWPHDVRLLCVSRLSDPNQISEVSAIHSRYDVVEYLIYRLCLPAVTADDLYGIALIVDNLVGSVDRWLTDGSRNTEPASEMNVGYEADNDLDPVGNQMTTDDIESISTTALSQNTRITETPDNEIDNEIEQQNLAAIDMTSEPDTQTNNDQESSTAPHENENEMKMSTEPTEEIENDDKSLASRDLLALLDNMTARELIILVAKHKYND